MKMYEISEKQIYELKDVLEYFKKDHSNFNTMQSLQMQKLEDVVDSLGNIFSGYADDEYKEVSIDELSDIMKEMFVDEGKYLAYDEGRNLWIAYDNSTADGFVEEFEGKRQAIDWLSDY